MYVCPVSTNKSALQERSTAATCNKEVKEGSEKMVSTHWLTRKLKAEEVSLQVTFPDGKKLPKYSRFALYAIPISARLYPKASLVWYSYTTTDGQSLIYLVKLLNENVLYNWPYLICWRVGNKNHS